MHALRVVGMPACTADRRRQEKKRLFAEKIASNPFAFLDAEDGAEEEPEEAPQPPASNAKENPVSKKKKKKSKPADPAAAASAPPAAQTATAEERDEGEAEEAGGRAGDGEVERIHAELQPVEEAMDFSDAAAGSGQAAEAADLRLNAALMTRRGIDHENEDRGLLSELTKYVSESVKTGLLLRSRARTIPVFAVFDGHGGSGASEYAKEHLVPNVGRALEAVFAHGIDGDAAIREAYESGFARTEEELRAAAGSDRSGTCAVCVAVWEQDGVITLHSANLGDCRAMVARRDSATGKLVGVRVTEDHRATGPEERRRIEAAGTPRRPGSALACRQAVLVSALRMARSRWPSHIVSGLMVSPGFILGPGVLRTEVPGRPRGGVGREGRVGARAPLRRRFRWPRADAPRPAFIQQHCGVMPLRAT